MSRPADLKVLRVARDRRVARVLRSPDLPVLWAEDGAPVLPPYRDSVVALLPIVRRVMVPDLATGRNRPERRQIGCAGLADGVLVVTDDIHDDDLDEVYAALTAPAAPAPTRG